MEKINITFVKAKKKSQVFGKGVKSYLFF